MNRLELLVPKVNDGSVEQVDRLERLLYLLLEDKVVGNVVKGPLRVPTTNITGRAFA